MKKEFIIENGILRKYNGNGGDVIIPNVCGTGIDVISTRNMEKIK